MGGANGKGKKKSPRDGKPGGKNANYKKTMKGGGGGGGNATAKSSAASTLETQIESA